MSDETTTPATVAKPKKNVLQTIETVVEAPVKFAIKEFGIIATSFKKEEPIIQQDLVAVSGVLQIIKTNLALEYPVIKYLVLKQFPQFTETQLNSWLTTGINDLGFAATIATPDLSTTIQNIAQHLLGVTDTGWNLFWDGLYKAISMVAVPSTTWENILKYAVYVYQVLVKPVIS